MFKDYSDATTEENVAISSYGALMVVSLADNEKFLLEWGKGYIWRNGKTPRKNSDTIKGLNDKRPWSCAKDVTRFQCLTLWIAGQ